MAKSAVRTVDQYIDAQPAPARATLSRVRAVLRRAIGDAEEIISYQIPAYRLPGGTVLHFAGWKQHYSLYPITEEIIETLASQLGPYEVNHKGTIRFPLSAPVPAGLITRIAKLRLEELRAREGAKAKAKPAARKASPKPKAKLAKTKAEPAKAKAKASAKITKTKTKPTKTKPAKAKAKAEVKPSAKPKPTRRRT
jgi:uncharacterized protein YdhG (YjbR/CyaY superfamily)